MHAEVEGEKSGGPSDRHRGAAAVLIGGDETTRHTLSGGTGQLLRHPDQHQRAASTILELLPNAVEEMLRWTAPVKNMCRERSSPTPSSTAPSSEQGEKMMLVVRVGELRREGVRGPESFDIDRYPNNHLAFGFGTHFCLGNQLARLELSLMQTTAAAAAAGYATRLR